MTKPLRQNDITILSDLEHVLLRPGMYIGSKNEEILQSYIYEDDKIVSKELRQIPGLIKLFDEIISNSMDEAIRSNFKYATKIKVSTNELGEITVHDNGRGLPIEFNDDLKKWTPEIIFTTLRAGSNFDDENKGMVVGQNGVGGSLVPIFSKTFEIDSANGQKRFTQTYDLHLTKKSKAVVSDSTNNYTQIKYIPNYDYFDVDIYNDIEFRTNMNQLIYKRVKDLAFAYPEITFWFNKEKISTSNLKEFLKQIHEINEFNENSFGRLGVFCSETEFQQISFVNGAYTFRGGTHIDYAMAKIIEHLRQFLKKKHKIEVKPIDIRTRIFLMLSIRMNNPQFDNQSKERLISSNNFKETLDDLISKKFLIQLQNNQEIILPIVETYELKEQVKENIKLKNLNSQPKKVKVDKYFPATNNKKYLFLAEGDSAVNSVMSSLGREEYSYFALKGKPLNALEVKLTRVADNDEYKNICTILNLDLTKKEQVEMSHEYVVLATDADLDGLSIRSLSLCFFYRFTPDLLRKKKICFLKTPMMIGKRNNKVEKYFFEFSDYKKYVDENGTKGYEWTYLKGLGSWPEGDLQYIIKKDGIDKFLFHYEMNTEDEQMLKNWMSKTTVEYRKNALRGKSISVDMS